MGVGGGGSHTLSVDQTPSTCVSGSCSYPVTVPVSHPYLHVFSKCTLLLSASRSHRGRATTAATSLSVHPVCNLLRPGRIRLGPTLDPESLRLWGMGGGPQKSAFLPALLADFRGLKFENYFPGS